MNEIYGSLNSWRNVLITTLLFGVIIIAVYGFSTNSHEAIAIAVCTIMGISISIIGTLVGIYAVTENSRFNRIVFFVNTQEKLNTICISPIESTMGLIKSVGDVIYIPDNRKMVDVNLFEIPQAICNIYPSINKMIAGLSILKCYCDKSTYLSICNHCHVISELADKFNIMIDAKQFDRVTFDILFKLRSECNKLYTDVVNITLQAKIDNT